MALFRGAVLVCRECEVEFKVPPSRRNIAKYCSAKCADIHRNDNRVVDKVKLTCLRCGDTFHEYPSHSKRRRYCSYKCTCEELAERCGGKSDSHFYNRAYWRKIRQLILERDDHRCRECAGGKDRMHVHHIVERKRGGEDKEFNLLTLCGPCHAKKRSVPAPIR